MNVLRLLRGSSSVEAPSTMLRLVTGTRRASRRKLAGRRPADPLDARRHAYKQNPYCCDCHSRIRRPEHAALVVPTGRLAHRHGCFARALAALNLPLAVASTTGDRQ